MGELDEIVSKENDPETKTSTTGDDSTLTFARGRMGVQMPN